MATEADDKRHLEQLVIRHNAQARLTYEIASQIAPYLPLSSFEQLTKELKTLTVDGQVLPLDMFAAHVPRDLFPIEGLEQLVSALTGGVQRAIALGSSPSFKIMNPAARQLLATTLSLDPRRRVAPAVAYFSGRQSSPAKGS
jgi:hypothetical protein